MLIGYVQAAMRYARYQPDATGEHVYGTIPMLRGVQAIATNQQECREQLQTRLERWLLVRLRNRQPIPAIDGIDLDEYRYDMPTIQDHPHRTRRHAVQRPAQFNDYESAMSFDLYHARYHKDPEDL